MMRYASVSKVLGLLLLGAVSYAASSYVVNAAQRAHVTRNSPAEGGTITEGEFVPGRAQLGPDEIAIPLDPQVSANRVVITGLTPTAGGVIVDGSASLAKTPYDRPFVWSLAYRTEGSKSPGVERRYDHQPGLSPKGSLSRPTFRERLALPPGSYEVLLKISEIPPGGVDSLGDPENAMSYSLASDVKDVVIP